MIYTEMTKKAINVMYQAHQGQMDKGGFPYCFHPYQVAQGMDDEISCAAALLHDIVEDTPCTVDDLRAQGFPDAVCDAVALLTHRDGEAYLDYVRRVKENPVAAKVKLADLRHNSDPTRLDTVTHADLARMDKYRAAIALLLEE